MTNTVTGAVAKREASAGVVERVKRATKWFGILGPSHASPQAFVQLSLAQLSKVRDLREAAIDNPEAFLSAMAECARLGLMPGDTGFYIPFRRKAKEDRPAGWDITFMTHWTGEVELMYRTGLVERVVCSEVRAKDRFVWNRTAMRVPLHEVAANDEGQIGLADDEERGKLTAVYCYVVFKDGGTSQPTVMTAREVGRHRAVSRAGAEFWGPAYPAEGPWTVDMWRKTAIHKHSGSVPTSPEYLALTSQAMAAAIESPDAPEGVEVGRGEQYVDAGDMVPPMLTTGDERLPSGTITGAATARTDDKPMTKGAALNEIRAMYKQAGLEGPQWRRMTTRLTAIFASPGGQPAKIDTPSDLLADQARVAARTLGDIIARCTQENRNCRDVLLRIAFSAQVWDGTDPPAPAGYDPNPPEQDGDVKA